jgi:molybdopterin-biosynthesis enzyme MoeA-like protein
MHLPEHPAMGVVVVGDELLSGKRQDHHLPHVIQVLAARGMRVAWCRYEGDDEQRLVASFRQTRLEHVPVLCFGGIGATPDDRTRQAAALAFDVPLVPHPQAVELIEQQFGAEAYPVRIHMAQLPDACSLIPNPHNRIPGFSLCGHYFFPGFPQMAWPMLDWVLDTEYPQRYAAIVEYAVEVHGISESGLCGLMEALAERHPQARLFSLPRLGPEGYIELGFRGETVAVEAAFSDMVKELNARDLTFEFAARR